VHIVQVDILGIRKHIDLYADSLIRNNLQYHSVFFEEQAYRLTDRFDKGELPFPVHDAVRQELKHERMI